MKRILGNLVLVLFSTVLGSPFGGLGTAQTGRSEATSARAERFEIKPADSPLGGSLYLRVNGTERKVYDPVFAAWIINDGRDVVFSSSDGAGGFENEGQSLRIYHVQSRLTRKIMSEYTGVNAVQAAKTSNGALALLVKLQDGGLGGSYFAVVDPERGEVFYRQWAEATAINGDMVTLAFYRETDWEKINDARDWKEGSTDTVISTTKVKPVKIEQVDLKMALKGPVITNRNSYDLADEQPRTKDVKIYLWNVNSKTAGIDLTAVLRQANSRAPLRPALEALFAGATKEEEEKGLSSSTFGMKFVGVTLQNGLATVKFSQPPNQTNYGSLGPMVFSQAIEKTARQFLTVKKVEICAVGDTLIDAQLEKPFPRCRK
ncbi:MAG TPA: GerMN domain-containing protein [Pyrinomonadaceae bacterium]|nr:GerMN domain-containing protein [Pyrinomonadaceae bacterium]